MIVYIPVTNATIQVKSINTVEIQFEIKNKELIKTTETIWISVVTIIQKVANKIIDAGRKIFKRGISFHQRCIAQQII